LALDAERDTGVLSFFPPFFTHFDFPWWFCQWLLCLDADLTPLTELNAKKKCCTIYLICHHLKLAFSDYLNAAAPTRKAIVVIGKPHSVLLACTSLSALDFSVLLQHVENACITKLKYQTPLFTILCTLLLSSAIFAGICAFIWFAIS
jgi:hypothetical protein